MIEFTKGDMFNASVDARVNTVNCVGVMGTGVALAFKKRYPDMFKDYENACREGRVRPGALHIWKSLRGDWIINFPTKRDWRDPSRYEDILSGLESLRNYLRDQGPISVALPALGCGNGGLDWGRVSSMIKSSLADVRARILVFQPQDSRNAGHALHVQLTEEEVREVKDLGFMPSDLSLGQEAEVPTSTVLSKGDPTLLTRRWVALLPSKDPTEREMAALNAVAHEMASSAKSVPIALVHTTRNTERVAELFLTEGIPVVLILPFGPLSRKSVARTPTDSQSAPFAMVSLASPSEPWGRPILGDSMRLLKDNARSVLLSDPDPTWLNKKSMRNWVQRPTFYLRYESLPEVVVHALDAAGARPIGRRLGTGEPNLAALFDSPAPSRRSSGEERTGGHVPTSAPRRSNAVTLTHEKRSVIRSELERASAFVGKVEKLVAARKQPSAGDRDILLARYWALTLDYHKGILSLLTNGFSGGAFALVSSVADALIRSHVALIGSDEDLRKIKEDAYTPDFKTIGSQIESSFELNGLFKTLLANAQDAHHSLVHSGTSQLDRFGEGIYSKPVYSEKEIVELIRNTTIAVFIITNLVTKHFEFEPEAKATADLFSKWEKQFRSR